MQGSECQSKIRAESLISIHKNIFVFQDMVRPYMNTAFLRVVFGRGMNVGVSASLQHMSAAYVSLLLACLSWHVGLEASQQTAYWQLFHKRHIIASTLIWHFCFLQAVWCIWLGPYLLPHKSPKSSFQQNDATMRKLWGQPGTLMVTKREVGNWEKPLSNAWVQSVRGSRADHQSLNAPYYRHPSSLRSLVSGKAVALLVVIGFNTRGNHTLCHLLLKINIIAITKYYRYNTGELWDPRSQYNLKITINTTYTLNSVLLNVHMNPQKLLNRNPISAIALDGVQATLSSFLRTLQSMVLWWAMKKIESTMIISSNTYVECWCIVQCLNITFSRYFWW